MMLLGISYISNSFRDHGNLLCASIRVVPIIELKLNGHKTISSIVAIEEKTRDLSTRRSQRAQRAQSLRQERSNPRLGFKMPLRSLRTLR